MLKNEGWPTKSAICISITCRKISNAPLSIKYPQQTLKWELGKFILKKKCSTLGKKSRFGHTSFIKVVINGTITNNRSQTPHEGFLKAGKDECGENHASYTYI